ncbi:uncharacterized protein LOC141628888 [Silene latifolia]|uniref:uncharacterized protein LOC141628888 n=1 Tax=Silene latifolia TaxID=37657 RepID=UPI003D774613
MDQPSEGESQARKCLALLVIPSLVFDDLPKGFLLPTANVGTFGIHPSFLDLVERNLFKGVVDEDPVKHVELFTDYCSAIPLAAGVTQDKVKEFLFSFTLIDDAKDWWRDLDKEAAGVKDWSSLALAFYRRYFPPQRTNALRSQITNFTQSAAEDLSEAWARFKKLVRSVPHHRLEQWYLCNQFYNGLLYEQRAVLEAAAQGRFQANVASDKGWSLIENMAIYTADYGSPRSARTEVKENVQQVFSLNILEEICGRCGEEGHDPISCMADSKRVLAYRKFKQGSSFSELYADLTAAEPQNPIEQGQVRITQAEYNDLKATIHAQKLEQQSSIEVFRQMVDRCGSLLFDKDPVNAINLRSGLSYGGPDLVKKNAETDVLEAPGRLKRVKKTEPEFARFGEIVRGLNVNVPFIELLKKVPSYLKFMRKILMRKRSVDVVKTVALTEECSAFLQNRSLTKLSDPGLSIADTGDVIGSSATDEESEVDDKADVHGQSKRKKVEMKTETGAEPKKKKSPMKTIWRPTSTTKDVEGISMSQEPFAGLLACFGT